MHKGLISIGDKIDIKPLNNEGKPVSGARVFASQLVNIENTEIIHIAAPIVYNKIKLLNNGENYNLCFYSEKGLYQCNCVVLGNYRDNKTIVTVVKLTSNLVKFQRREYYRLECIHDIEYRLVTLEEEIQATKEKNIGNKDGNEHVVPNEQTASRPKYTWLKGTVIDISGGGARLNSPIIQKKGDKIKIKLELVIGNNLRSMELEAVIIASDRVMDRRDLYEHRVQFNNISRKDRDDIIKYIFEQDRRRRKNES